MRQLGVLAGAIYTYNTTLWYIVYIFNRSSSKHYKTMCGSEGEERLHTTGRLYRQVYYTFILRF